MYGELDPDEEEAILRFLAGGRPLKQRARGRRRRSLPLVPDLLDEVELLIAQHMPEQEHRAVVAVARQWSRAGFTIAREIPEWIRIGVSLRDPYLAGEFRARGIPAAVAAQNAGRYANTDYSQFTYFELAKHGFLTPDGVRVILEQKGLIDRVG